MPQASGFEIVQQPGFWDKPQAEQVQALSGISETFRDASPEAQETALRSLRKVTGMQQGQVRKAITGPPGNQQPGFFENLSQAMDKQAFASAFKIPTTLQSYEELGRRIKRGAEKATGKGWKDIEKDHPKISGTYEFLFGASKAIPQLADYLMSPSGVATTLAGGVGGVPGVIAKLPPALKALAGAYFSTQMAIPAAEMVVGARPVSAEHLGEGLAGLTIGTLGAARGLKESLREPAKVRADLTEPPPNPLDPAIAAKADLARIDQAKATAAAEKAKIQDAEGYNGYRAGPPTERQEVIPTTEQRRQQRTAEAAARSRNPQLLPPSVGTEGVGQRIAPEEVGEFPSQAPPRQKPLGAPKPEAKAPAAAPDGGGPLRPGVERQFIVKRKFFGVPEGSRIAIIEDPKTGQQTVSLVDESGNKKPIQLPVRSAVASLVGKGWVEPARPLPASNVGQAPAAPMELPGPKPAPAAAPRPVAATPPKPAPVAVAPPAEVKPPIERKAPPPRKPAAKPTATDRPAAPPTAAKSSPVDLASLMDERDALLAARAKLEAGSAPPEAPAKPAASPKPAAKAPPPAPPPEPVKAAAPAPAVSPQNLAQVTGAVQHIIDTQITPTRKGKTGWARVEVQPINEDFRPVGEPVTMDAKDFTPEKIAALAGQHPEARGIRVGSDPPLKTEGTISRKFDSFEAGPPKDPSSAKSGGSAPTAPTWESIGTDKQRAFARAALEMDPETASPSEEDIQFTVDTMGGLAKTEGLRQALTGYGLNQKQILAILFGKE